MKTEPVTCFPDAQGHLGQAAVTDDRVEVLMLCFSAFLAGPGLAAER